MLCAGCNSRFDKKERAQKKLPECGHSLCEYCLEKHKIGVIFTCPTCGKRQKRVAESQGLASAASSSKPPIKIKQGKGNSGGKEESSSSEAEENDDMGFDSLSGINQSEHLCPVHYKAFDGFCLTCKCLICIDCIFEKHKPHDFYPLDKAKERAVADLHKRKLEIEQLRDECAQRLTSARGVQEDISKVLEQRILDVRSIMNEMRRYILLREQKLEEKLTEEFERCREENNTRILGVERDLYKIDTLLSVIQHHTGQSEVKFLGKIWVMKMSTKDSLSLWMKLLSL